VAFNFGGIEIQGITRVNLAIYFSDLYIQNRSREKTHRTKKIGKVSRKFFLEPNRRKEKQKKSTRPKGESGRQQ
jgi:hypothetical protein